MLDWIIKGGLVMIPIILFSIIALAIFMERLWSLQIYKIVPPQFIERIKQLVQGRKISEALVLCQDNPSSIARVYYSAIKAINRKRNDIKITVEEVGRQEGAGLERFLGMLSTIASISPLLGLLGTVIGMISVFKKITTEGVGDPRILANGIWEALITTAAGLIVAIPAYIAFRYLQSKCHRLLLKMEEEAISLIELIKDSHELQPKP